MEARHKTLFPHGLQICLLLLLCINKKIDPAFVFIAPCRAGSSMLSLYLEYIWLVFLTAVLDIRKLLDTFICVMCVTVYMYSLTV